MKRPCPKCRKLARMMEYEVFPRRDFNKIGNNNTFPLCEECRNQILTQLPPYELSWYKHLEEFLYFMQGTPRTKYRECPTCRNNKEMTRHHVFPKRIFKGSSLYFWLCRKCHDQLELLIPYKTDKASCVIAILTYLRDVPYGRHAKVNTR